MTPQEKGKQLVENFMYELMAITNISERYPIAKACALICVKEILGQIKSTPLEFILWADSELTWWESVKKSIKEEGQ